MNRRWVLLGVVLVAGGALGWYLTKPAPLPDSLSTVLRESTEFELFSIEPHPWRELDETSPNSFRRREVLGSTKVVDLGVRNHLVTTLERARPEGEAGIKCFSPRHAIRATYNAEVYEFLICFECEQVRAYKGKDLISEFLVGNRHQPPFDKVLTDAGVKLAVKPK